MWKKFFDQQKIRKITSEIQRRSGYSCNFLESIVIAGVVSLMKAEMPRFRGLTARYCVVLSVEKQSCRLQGR